MNCIHLSPPAMCSAAVMRRLGIRTPLFAASLQQLRSGRVQGGRRNSSTVAQSNLAADHTRYLGEVAIAPIPANIEPLLRVLQAQGNELVSPAARSGLHPLLIPLAQGPVTQSDTPNAAIRGGEAFTCLLRWAEPSTSNNLPVVRMSANSPAMVLVARSADEYLHRVLAEEDVREGSSGAVAAAAGEAGAAIYEPGSYARGGHKSMEAYLTRRAGMFVDVAEQLVTNHLQKEDVMSALITGEWYMRNNHFPRWGRPFEFNAHLYTSLNRLEESRDSARIALRMPWWTLLTGFEVVKGMASLSGDAASIRDQMDDDSGMQGPLPPGIGGATKTDSQLAVDEAEFLMNRVAAGEASWDDIREDLAAQYSAAGFINVADFITAA